VFFELLQSNEAGRARYLFFVGRKVKSLLHLIKAGRASERARTRAAVYVRVSVLNTRKQVRRIPRGPSVPAARNHARIIN